MPEAAPGVLFTTTTGRTSVDISFDHAREPLGEDELLARLLDDRSNHEYPARLTCEARATETGVALYIEVSAGSMDGISSAVETIARGASRLGTAMDAVSGVCVKRLRPCVHVERSLVLAVEEKLRTNGYEIHEAVLHEPREDSDRAFGFAIGTGRDENVLRLARSALIHRDSQGVRAARGAG